MNENQKPDIGMAKLMLSIAKAMPEEMLLEELKKAITQYEIKKTPEHKRGFQFYIQMTALRFMHEDESMDESLKTVDDIASMVQRDKIIKT